MGSMIMLSKNIVLIGMPGSGKTSIGKILAKQLNREFCDIDQYIEQTQDKRISDIFESGEDVFREIEKVSVKVISENTELVISTGGGVVKFPENIDNLKRSGIIFFIDRSVEDIISDVEVNTRPLLKDGVEKIYELYRERCELYKKYADYIVSNTGSLDDVAKKIIELIENEV